MAVKTIVLYEAVDTYLRFGRCCSIDPCRY